MLDSSRSRPATAISPPPKSPASPPSAQPCQLQREGLHLGGPVGASDSGTAPKPSWPGATGDAFVVSQAAPTAAWPPRPRPRSATPSSSETDSTTAALHVAPRGEGAEGRFPVPFESPWQTLSDLERRAIVLVGQDAAKNRALTSSADRAQQLLELWQRAMAVGVATRQLAGVTLGTPFALTTRDWLLQAMAAHLSPSTLVFIWGQASSDLADSLAGLLASRVVGSLRRHGRDGDAVRFIKLLAQTPCAHLCYPMLVAMLRSMRASSDHLLTQQLYASLVDATHGLLPDDVLGLVGCLISLQNNVLLAAHLQSDERSGVLRGAFNTRTSGTARSVLERHMTASIAGHIEAPRRRRAAAGSPGRPGMQQRRLTLRD